MNETSKFLSEKKSYFFHVFLSTGMLDYFWKGVTVNVYQASVVFEITWITYNFSLIRILHTTKVVQEGTSIVSDRFFHKQQFKFLFHKVFKISKNLSFKVIPQ